MLIVLTETYCNKVNIQITQRNDFIQYVNHNYDYINKIFIYEGDIFFTAYAPLNNKVAALLSVIQQ